MSYRQILNCKISEFCFSQSACVIVVCIQIVTWGMIADKDFIWVSAD